MTVPTTTISPWEKLVRPVVPKISESPMAIMANTRPNLMPSTVSCRNWSKRLDSSRELTAPSSWRAKRTRWVSCGLTWTVRVSVSGSTSSTPSGTVAGSMVTPYSPGPGTSSTNTPSSSVTPSPTSSSPTPVTVNATSTAGVSTASGPSPTS